MTGRKLFCNLLLTSTFILTLSPVILFGQGIPPNILDVKVEPYIPGSPLRITVLLTDDGELGECLLYFRTPDHIEYDYTPLIQEYDYYTAEIVPEFLDKGIIEYYIYAVDSEGNSRTSPEINPEQNPFSITLQQEPETSPTRIYLLSPEPGSRIFEDPELIVISLFDPDDDTAPESISLSVNGKDVTAKANISKYLVTYLPDEKFVPGSQEIEVTVEDEAGNVSDVAKFDFMVSEFKQKPKIKGKYRWSFDSDTDYDKYAGRQQPSHRPVDHTKSSLKGWGDWGWLKAESEIYFNTYINEDARSDADNRQTLNRYRLKLETVPYTLILGDANPRFSELTIKGTRIRGITSELNYGRLNFNLFYGESKNKINPYVIDQGDSVLVDSVYNPVTDSTEYIYQFGTAPPTYQRKSFGGRLAFDFGKLGSWFDEAELGINYLRFTDDIDDSLEFSQDLIDLGGYEFADFDSLQMESYILSLGIDPNSAEAEVYWNLWQDNWDSVEGGLGKPKDNIVGSATLDFRIMKKTFLSFETALSILNQNQFAETSLIDSSDDQDIIDMAAYMKKNFNFEFNNEINPFFPKPVFYMALKSPVYLIPTDLTMTYRYVPDTYNSLGNPSIQKDIKSLKMDTRTRLYKNRLNISVGGETKQNNLLNAKDQTTTTNSFYTSAGIIYPDYPSMNIGLRFISRKGVGLADVPQDTSFFFDPVTEETDTSYFYSDSAYTKNFTSTITTAFGYNYRYQDWSANSNLNLMYMHYNDKKNNDYDFSTGSYMFSVGVNTPYPATLDLGIGRSFNVPSSAQGNRTAYTMFNSRFSYHFYNRKLIPFIGIELLSGDRKPDQIYVYGIDSIKRTFKIGFSWKINPQTSLSLEGRAVKYDDNSGSPQDEESSYTENRIRFRFSIRM